MFTTLLNDGILITNGYDYAPPQQRQLTTHNHTTHNLMKAALTQQSHESGIFCFPDNADSNDGS